MKHPFWWLWSCSSFLWWVLKAILLAHAWNWIVLMYILTMSISRNVRLNLFWMFGFLLVNSTVKQLQAASKLEMSHSLSMSPRFSLSSNVFISLISIEIDSSPSHYFCKLQFRSLVNFLYLDRQNFQGSLIHARQVWIIPSTQYLILLYLHKMGFKILKYWSWL